MGKFARLVNTPKGMPAFRAQDRIPNDVELQHCELGEWLFMNRPPGSVVIMCSSGTLIVAPRAYKPWVGRISCRCGTRVSQGQSTPKIPNPTLSTENKTLRAWLPKKDKQLAGRGTKSSPTKRRFWGTVPISSIVRFGVGWDWLGHVSNLWPAQLCYPQGAHLYHYYMITFIEGEMKIPMGRVIRDFLINYRLTPTQCSSNVFRVLGSVDMINHKMGTNLTWHAVNWVHNCQKGKGTNYYIKCRVPAVRLISYMPKSNKSTDEDFLIVSGDWHDGMHCPTQDGEPGRVPTDIRCA